MAELMTQLVATRGDGSEVALVGTADHFTSHAWLYRFGLLVATLEEVHATTMATTGKVTFFWLGHSAAFFRACPHS